ncbi:MAG TPA: hypothetical protein VF221_01090 [Chloroflexota bacterium]
MSVDSSRENTYQWLLRALGAYLDEEPSCRISLAEVSDGFLVRLQRALHKLDPQVEHFKRETLKEQLEKLSTQRKPSSHARHQGVWSSFPNGHQDFFRALGYELDQASARGILIDELEDGIVVTYSYPDTSNGAKWKKRMVVLGLSEIEAILNAAFERRQKPAPPADAAPPSQSAPPSAP